jgi:hypothetical protein
LVAHGIIEGDGKKIVRSLHSDWAMGIEGCAVTIINLRPQEAAALEYVGEAE